MREGRSAGERESAAGTGVALAILTLLLTILFADVLAGVNSFYIRDIAYAAYPERLMLRDTVSGGEFPHWNRWRSAGQPLAANPGYGVFYPLTWLVLLPDFDFGFHLLLVIHIYIAAWTMFALLRSMRLRVPAAFFGALSFAAGGTCLALLDVHPLLQPLAWLPLTCLYTRRFLLHGARRDLALASFFFGVQVILGEVTVLLQTGLILGIYALHAGRKLGGTRGIVRAVASVGLISILALLVGTVQMLPAADLARDSVRAGGFTFDRVTSWSFPLTRVGEFLHPNLLGHQLLNGKRVYWGGMLYPDRGIPFVRSVYPGILMAALALAGAIAAVRGRAVLAGVFVTSLLLAFGAHTPLWRLLYDAGLVRSIRYPEKFILMAVFAVTVFGAVVLDRLLGADDERLQRVARRTAAALALLFGAIALVAMTPVYVPVFVAIWEPPAKILTEMLASSRSGWLLAAARATLLFLLLRNLTLVRRTKWLALVGVLVLLDLGMNVPELAPRVDPAFFHDPPAVARQLPPERHAWRLFHIGTWQTRTVGDYFSPQPDLYWIHRNGMYWMMPATWGIRTVIDTDYTRAALKPTGDFVDAVWEVSRRRADWLPAVASMSNAWFAAVNGNPAEAYVLARGNNRALQPVKLIELEHTPRYYFADRVETIRDDADFVEKLASARFPASTAFVRGFAGGLTPASPGSDPTPGVPPGVVRRVQESANRALIEVETRGRSFLVMSVTPHKYWRITVDGAEVPAVVTNLGYQGVVIPTAGRHVVGMRYRNPLFAIGGAVSLATFLGLALLARRRW